MSTTDRQQSLSVQGSPSEFLLQFLWVVYRPVLGSGADEQFLPQIVTVKVSLWALGFFVNFDSVTWDDKLVDGMDFLANSVLQIPFFLMSLMRYITPTLDHM